MRKQKLGKLEVSMLGLGTGRLASLRGGVSFETARRLVDVAEAGGVNYIDTADSYASGDCERLLGRLLKGRRNRFVLSSKAGYPYADLPGWMSPLNQVAKKVLHKAGVKQDHSPGGLRRRLDKSLRRLGTDHLEIFFFA